MPLLMYSYSVYLFTSASWNCPSVTPRWQVLAWRIWMVIQVEMSVALQRICISQTNLNSPMYNTTPSIKLLEKCGRQSAHKTMTNENYLTWDPIKNGILKAASPKTIVLSVYFTMMHLRTKFEEKKRNVSCRPHTRHQPKYDLWPYKRRNTGGSITKYNRFVDLTMMKEMWPAEPTQDIHQNMTLNL